MLSVSPLTDQGVTTAPQLQVCIALYVTTDIVTTYGHVCSNSECKLICKIYKMAEFLLWFFIVFLLHDGMWTSCIGVTWELVKNAEAWRQKKMVEE